MNTSVKDVTWRQNKCKSVQEYMLQTCASDMYYNNYIDYVCVHVTSIPASNKRRTSRRDKINLRSASCELFSVDVNMTDA